MTKIIMPQVGQDVPTAVIREWLKSEGDDVEKGEIIALVESDKATFEVEAEAEGVLTSILFEAGSEVAVFETIAILSGFDAAAGRSASDSTSGDVASEPSRLGTTGNGETLPSAGHAIAEGTGDAIENDVSGAIPPARLIASPAARRLAQENGIDLSTVKGSGHGGRIRFEDVELVLRTRVEPHETPADGPSEEADTIVPLTSMRKAIAARMSESIRTAPHFFVRADVDMTDALVWRKEFNAAYESGVTLTALIVKATAMALRGTPAFNAFVYEDRVVLKGARHVGIAIQVPHGLVVSVIPNADSKTLLEISAASREKAEAARKGLFQETTEGTFTVTSLGMHGVPEFFPIINPPQCAILAVGAVEKRVMPVPGGIGIRNMMTLILASDHRAVDGAGAAEFINKIKFSLENIRDVASAWVSA